MLLLLLLLFLLCLGHSDRVSLLAEYKPPLSPFESQSTAAEQGPTHPGYYCADCGHQRAIRGTRVSCEECGLDLCWACFEQRKAHNDKSHSCAARFQLFENPVKQVLAASFFILSSLCNIMYSLNELAVHWQWCVCYSFYGLVCFRLSPKPGRDRWQRRRLATWRSNPKRFINHNVSLLSEPPSLFVFTHISLCFMY